MALANCQIQFWTAGGKYFKTAHHLLESQINVQETWLFARTYCTSLNLTSALSSLPFSLSRAMYASTFRILPVQQMALWVISEILEVQANKPTALEECWKEPICNWTKTCNVTAAKKRRRRKESQLYLGWGANLLEWSCMKRLQCVCFPPWAPGVRERHTILNKWESGDKELTFCLWKRKIYKHNVAYMIMSELPCFIGGAP